MVFCDDLEREDGGMRGRPKREGTHVYIQLIHAVVKQKLTLHCKAIILSVFSH